MAALLFSVVEKVVSPACAETMVVDGNFFDSTCIKLSISKILGFAIVLGSVLGNVMRWSYF